MKNGWRQRHQQKHRVGFRSGFWFSNCKPQTGPKPKLLPLLLPLLLSISCTSTKVKSNAGGQDAPVSNVISSYTLDQLEQAALVFRVAYERSLESWQGVGDQAVPGCTISGVEAENGLNLIRPWIERKSEDEAKRLLDSPKKYKFAVNERTCDRDCSCNGPLHIFEAAKLEAYSHSKVKTLKALRAQFEATAELMSRERVDLCAEAATWVCASDLLKTVKATAVKKP